MSDQLTLLIINGLLIGGVYSLVALGFVVIYKASGIANFAQGSIMMIGALFAYLLITFLGLSIWPVALLTVTFCALLGYAVQRIFLQRLIGQPIMSSIMFTIALAWFLQSLFILVIGDKGSMLPSLFPGKAGIGELGISRALIYNFGAAVVLFILFAFIFLRTRIGLGMRATSEDHEVAQSLGISVKNVFSQVWIIAAVVAGIAGILLGNSINVSIALEEIGWKGLIVALIGGLDSIPGCIIAGLLIGLLENLAALYLSPIVGGGIREVAAYAVMLLIMIFRPYGLLGLRRIERI